jgi:hypothetical protein
MPDSSAFESYRNLHAGADICILSCGPSAASAPDLSRHLTLGISDCWRWQMTRYLLCVDDLTEGDRHRASVGRDARWPWVAGAACPTFVLHQHLAKRLGGRAVWFPTEALHVRGPGKDLLDQPEITTYHTSDFVAVGLAWWMGARRIFLFGVDHHGTHPFDDETWSLAGAEMSTLKEWKRLGDEIRRKGGGVWVMNSSSRLAQVVREIAPTPIVPVGTLDMIGGAEAVSPARMPEAEAEPPRPPVPEPVCAAVRTDGRRPGERRRARGRAG